MFREELAGTYWYCVNKDGSTWLIQREGKPRRNSYGGWGYSGDGAIMNWLMLNNGKHPADEVKRKDGTKVLSADFENVNFPERTYEDDALEIEITRSGKVYWYGD